MQYIQLQPQNATQIPAAPLGAFNLFVDANNNIIKLKDVSGTTNVSVGVTEVTKVQMDTLIADSGLTVGAFYKITGVNTSLYGGTNIILQATATNILSKSGWGEFYNPKYYDNFHNLPNTYYVWDNTIRLHFTSTTGLFNYGDYLIINNGDVYGYLFSNIGQNYLTLVPDGQNTIDFLANAGNYPLTITSDNTGAVANIDASDYVTTYTAGTKVIWGNKVWTNVTGNNGSSPNMQTLDSNDWAFVPYNTTDYNLVWDIIEYEYEWDNISYRKDGSNEVTCNHAFIWDYEANNTIAYFPWGNYWVQNIVLHNCSTYTLVNFPNYGNRMSYVKCYDYSFFDCNWNDYFNGTTWGRNTGIYNITIDTYSYVNFSLGYNNNLNSINIGKRCNFNSLYTYDNDAGNAQISYLTLNNQSYFNSDDYPIYMYSNSQIRYVTLNNSSYFTGVIMYPNSTIEYITLDNNSQFDNIHIGNGSYMGKIDLTNNSYYNGVNTDVNTSVYNISMTNNSSFYGNINLNTGSSIYNVVLNASSLSNINLDTNSVLDNIQLGSNSQLINIYLGYGSNIENIDIGVDSYINNVETSTGASINNISLGTDSYINSLYGRIMTSQSR